MRPSLIAAVAVLAAAPVAALAQSGPARVRYYAPPPALSYLTPDEARDYARDQLERRQEIERHALRMNQKAQRRALGLDDDD